MPGIVVEEEYSATTMVTESEVDNGVLLEEELYGEGTDDATDRMPGWRHLITDDLGSRSVTTSAVDTSARTWHTGIS
jgi:hypothetical protein